MSNADNRDPDNGNSALALGGDLYPGPERRRAAYSRASYPGKRSAAHVTGGPVDSPHGRTGDRLQPRWEAKLDAAKTISPAVEDRVHDSHGRPAAKLMGMVPVKKLVGREADRREPARYLASIVLCPSILLNHETLRWNLLKPLRLRVHDLRHAPPHPAASLDIDLPDEGRSGALPCPSPALGQKGEPSRLRGPPVAVSFAKGKGSARPRGGKFPGAFWEGEFTYYRGETTSFVALR